MGPAIGAGAILVIIIGLLVHQVREGDKDLARLEMANALAIQAAKHKTAIQLKIKTLTETFAGVKTKLESTIQEKDNELFKKSLTAAQDANDLPIEFGDDFVTDILTLDCLWSLGQDQGDNSSRAACVREANMADGAAQIVPVTVINPDFRTYWSDACQDWDGISNTPDYTKEVWELEYPGFDVKLCQQTVVVFTPEFSYYFRKFLKKGENYTAKLINFAKENRELLDIIAARPAQ